MSSELLNAAILGIVEGITEYLPISSTGHLVLAAHLLSFQGEKAETFEIFIQLGAILAVVILYFNRFRALLNFRAPGSFGGISGLAKLGLATLPAAVAGLLFHKAIKAHLFAPAPVAGALIAGGVVLLLFERRLGPRTIERIEDISYREALLTGVFQCCALWPGVSRSGSMIVGGMLLGMSRVAAAEFSFLAAVPIMALATVYDLYKSRGLLSSADIPMFAVGFFVAFITAVIAIRFFLDLLRRYSLAPYGAYRIALGIIVLTTLSSL